MITTSTTPRRLPLAAKVLITVASVVVIGALTAVGIMWFTGMSESTTRVQSVADRVEGPAVWGESTVELTPATILCNGPGQCPKAVVEWMPDDAVTLEQMQAMVDSSALPVRLFGDCIDDPRHLGDEETWDCFGAGTADGVGMVVSYEYGSVQVFLRPTAVAAAD